jgi:UDP-N-acetylmuramate dehydrogenase
VNELENNFLKKFNIKKEINLATYTTWKVGGNARYFWEPERQFIPEVINICAKNKIPVYILGRGSNVLIDDNGINGLVICTKRRLKCIDHDEDYINVEAGVTMPELAMYALKLGYTGFEFLIGIPGTIGAGVVINAGLTSKAIVEIKDVLADIEYIDEYGEANVLPVDDLELSYRSSKLLKKRSFVVSARFNLTEKISYSDIHNKMSEYLTIRKKKQPLARATAGSTFKQPKEGKPAGWYIDNAGLKGFQVGRAKVSEIHANWIENIGGASSDEIKKLIQFIQDVVYDKYGILLEREIHYLPDDFYK